MIYALTSEQLPRVLWIQCQIRREASSAQMNKVQHLHSSWLVRGEGTDVITLLQESPHTAKLPLAREARQLLYNLVFLTGRELHFISLLNLYKIYKSIKSVAHSCFKRNL